MFNSKLVKTLLIASTVVGLPAMADTSNAGIEKTQVKVGSAQCAGGEFQGRKAFKMEKRLGLSDTQLEKVAVLKDKSRTDTAAQKAQLKTLSDQLKLVITKPEINQSEAMQIQSKINDLRSQLSNEKLQERIDFMSILTPEQRENLRHRMLVSEAFGFSGGHRMHHHFGNRA
ncbi:MAG TPA: hypothetical protein V6C97_35700 [Oculatellaceae cyanobacterium]